MHHCFVPGRLTREPCQPLDQTMCTEILFVFKRLSCCSDANKKWPRQRCKSFRHGRYACGTLSEQLALPKNAHPGAARRDKMGSIAAFKKPCCTSGFQSVLAPASNHCLISCRSASVMPVALFMGINLVTTTCWYTACAWVLRCCAESRRTLFICTCSPWHR